MDEMSDYERLRERNIAERKSFFEATFGGQKEVDAAKNLIVTGLKDGPTTSSEAGDGIPTNPAPSTSSGAVSNMSSGKLYPRVSFNDCPYLGAAVNVSGGCNQGKLKINFPWL